jgi:hypothetical protein
MTAPIAAHPQDTRRLFTADGKTMITRASGSALTEKSPRWFAQDITGIVAGDLGWFDSVENAEQRLEVKFVR